jgi:hypothetical protein
MSTEPDSTIAMLERAIEDAEQKIRALRAAINTICTEAGLPARYAEAALTNAAGPRISQIQDDTFYGKKQTPAMREYLEMRRAHGLGPAKPREFYDALKSGGYQFEAKDDDTAIVGLRALLRTQPQIFHRLPQGTYGLTSWYPDAKRSRGDEASSSSKKKGKKRGGRSKKAARTSVKASEPRKVEEKAEAEKRGLGAPTPNVVPLKDQKAA